MAAEQQLRTDVDPKAPTMVGREQLTREIPNDARKVIVALGIELMTCASSGCIKEVRNVRWSWL